MPALKRTKSLVKNISRVLLALYLLICNSFFLSVIFLIGTHPHWFSMLSFICIGIFAHLITWIMVAKTLLFLVRTWGPFKVRTRRTSDHKIAVMDKMATSSGQVLAIFIYSVSLGLYGVYRAWQPPVVVRQDITLPKFPGAMNGLRILQISDIHLGETVGRKSVEMIVDISQELDPGKTRLGFAQQRSKTEASSVGRMSMYTESPEHKVQLYLPLPTRSPNLLACLFLCLSGRESTQRSTLHLCSWG